MGQGDEGKEVAQEGKEEMIRAWAAEKFWQIVECLEGPLPRGYTCSDCQSTGKCHWSFHYLCRDGYCMDPERISWKSQPE